MPMLSVLNLSPQHLWDNIAEARAISESVPPQVVESPEQCPFTLRRMKPDCNECAKWYGTLAVNSLHPVTRTVYDTSRCLYRRQQPEELQERERAELRERCLAAGLTETEMEENFGKAKRDPYNADAFDAVQGWLPTHQNLFILSRRGERNEWTGNGQGKSFLMHCLTRKLCQLGVRVLYRLSHVLAEEWRKAVAENDEYFGVDYELADVLILDNLGGEAVKSEWLPEKLFCLVNSRLRNDKPTIATTRCNIDELTAHYGGMGADIVSRLSSGKVVQIGGPDRRIQRCI